MVLIRTRRRRMGVRDLWRVCAAKTVVKLGDVLAYCRSLVPAGKAATVSVEASVALKVVLQSQKLTWLRSA